MRTTPNRSWVLLGSVAISAILRLGSLAADEPDAEPPRLPPVGVTTDSVGELSLLRAVLPGRVVALTVLRNADRSSLAILLAAEGDPDGPRAVYRLDPAAEPSLQQLTGDLPDRIDAVASLPIEGSDHHQLIVGEPDRIYGLGPPDTPGSDLLARLLLETPGLDLGMLQRRRWIRPDHPWILVPGLGTLDVFACCRDGQMELQRSLELPIRARRKRGELHLSTPRFHWLTPPDEPLGFAVGPEQIGSRRLLTTLLASDSDGASGSATVEAWAQLPAHERVAQSWYLAADGQPLLVVASLRADKIGIFEKKKLRVFPLRTDRTRAGAGPLLEAETDTRNWYDLEVYSEDVDGDGLEDLIVVQPSGLGAKKLVVEAYPGRGRGQLSTPPRRSVIVAPQATWAYGADLDGDRTCDLATVDQEGRVRVFRGLASHKKLVVEKSPRWELGPDPHARPDNRSVHIEVGTEDTEGWTEESAFAAPWPVDLDHDGRDELLLRFEAGGRSVLQILKLR